MLFNKLPYHAIKQVLGIIVGAIIVALSINLFILSNHIADGGITGIALILHYLFQWDVGLTVFIINIPLFIFGYKAVGKKLIFMSILGVAILSIALKYTAGIMIITSNNLLASIFGGLATGIGMGIIFRSRGSLGGSDIIAIVLNKRTPFSVGQILLGIDVIILLGAAIIFQPEMALYAMIYMFIAAKVIDLVQVGLDYSKSVIVVTAKPQEIAADIMTNLERGVTLFEAKGAYSGTDKEVVYCVVNRAQLTQVKEIVLKNDSKAFITIGDVSEVIGEGFKEP